MAAIHPSPAQGDAIRKAGDVCHRRRQAPFVKKQFHKWLE
jgi:hypothetical protein